MTNLIRSNAVGQARDINLDATNVLVNTMSNRISVTCNYTFTPVMRWPTNLWLISLPRTVQFSRTVVMPILQ